MTAEEYPALLSDPSDFIVRRYWPRIFGALKGLENLTPLHDMLSYGTLVTSTLAFGMAEVTKAFDALKKASEESKEVMAYHRKFEQRAREEGFPIEAGLRRRLPLIPSATSSGARRASCSTCTEGPTWCLKHVKHFFHSWSKKLSLAPGRPEIRVSSYRYTKVLTVLCRENSSSSFTGLRCRS